MVEFPGDERQTQYQAKYELHEQQAQALRDKIKLIEVEILPIIQS